MAWTEQCKIAFYMTLSNRLGMMPADKKNVQQALREVAAESDIPKDTLQRWYYEHEREKKERQKTFAKNDKGWLCKKCKVRHVSRSQKTGKPMDHGLCRQCLKRENQEAKDQEAKEKFEATPIDIEADRNWQALIIDLEDVLEKHEQNELYGKVSKDTLHQIINVTNHLVHLQSEVFKESTFENGG